MGLFDDILNKPQETAPSDTTAQGSTTSGTGGNPPTDDSNITGMPEFMIEKTEEKSLFENPVNESISTESANISPEIPVEPSILNEVEVSSPIVSGDSIIINTVEADPIVPVEENTISPEILTPIAGSVDSSVATDNSILSFGESEETKNISDKTDDQTDVLSMEDVLHLREFLSKSIENVDTMVADIDTTHAAKVQEAE